MISFDPTMQKTVLVYFLGAYLLYQSKHESMFTKDNKFKQFGVGKEKTVTPFWLVSLVIGLVSYLYFVVRSDDLV